MHLSAHLVFGFEDCTLGLLFPFPLRFPLPFFLELPKDVGTTSCASSAGGGFEGGSGTTG